MRKVLNLLCLGLAASAASLAGGAQPVQNTGGFAVICPVDGEINDGIAVLVRRAVEKEAAGAGALVLVIDTFGGRVDSAIEITEHLLGAPCPTIAYITGKGAISAGALIAYACDHIIMAPGTNIGASTPFMPAAEASQQVNEKSMSFLRAKYRALGELKGHNPLIGEAMVDEDIELYAVPDPAAGYRILKMDSGLIQETLPMSLKPEKSPVDIVFDVLGAEQDPHLKNLKEVVKQATSDKAAPAAPETPDTPEPPETATAAPAAPPKDLPPNAKLVSAAGKLLTLTSQEALDLGLISAVLDTPEAALAHYGHASLRPVRIEMNWDEALFAFLTSPLVAGLLLMCGVGGIYLEFKTPGLGWAGLIGVLCLAVFFGSRFVVGMAGWMDIILVVSGLALLAAEIFLIPGFGVAGFSGIVCLFLGIYLALTRVPVPQYSWDFDRLTDAGTSLMTAAALFLAFIWLTWKVFPATPLARGLVQAHAQLAEAGYVVQTHADAALAVGMRGISATMLRPAGRGRFGGQNLDVMTRGEFVEPGRPIEVIQAEGNRYVVRETEEEHHGDQ
ncbi:MAG: hypothetical protein H3C30_02370 [Candidatus Hydrogenedentes bacterium]|nr:hypothetical protein [Candidatus Hydrogenedentota bacterium]